MSLVNYQQMPGCTQDKLQVVLSVRVMAFRNFATDWRQRSRALLISMTATGTFGYREMIDVCGSKSSNLGSHSQELEFLLDQWKRRKNWLNQ